MSGLEVLATGYLIVVAVLAALGIALKLLGYFRWNRKFDQIIAEMGEVSPEAQKVLQAAVKNPISFRETISSAISVCLFITALAVVLSRA